MALYAATRQYWRSCAGSSRTLIMTRGMATGGMTEGVKKNKIAMMKGEYAPIYLIFGFVGLAILFGGQTVKQLVCYAPRNYFNKNKRGSFPEIDSPDSLASGSRNFIQKSFLRKVAHIQKPSPPLAGIRNTPETLKSVGVKPRVP